MKILTDSSSAKSNTTRRGPGRRKHIQLRMLAVQDWVQRRPLAVGRVTSHENLINILTKSMPVQKHCELGPRIGLRGHRLDKSRQTQEKPRTENPPPKKTRKKKKNTPRKKNKKDQGKHRKQETNGKPRKEKDQKTNKTYRTYKASPLLLPSPSGGIGGGSSSLPVWWRLACRTLFGARSDPHLPSVVDHPPIPLMEDYSNLYV